MINLRSCANSCVFACCADAMQPPAFTANLLRDGLTLGVTGSNDLPFNIAPPPAHTFAIVVDMQWCSAAVASSTPSMLSVYNGSVSITLLGFVSNNSNADTAPHDVVLTMASSNVTVTTNGACLRVQCRSTPMQLSGQFSAIDISITHAGQAIHAGNVAGMLTYAPVTRPGGLVVVFDAATALVGIGIIGVSVFFAVDA